jgi:AcrR family transcriptional regulator
MALEQRPPTETPASADPRPGRRAARFERILSAAWSIAEEQGLAGVSLREVARRVGLRQPSLYAYIDSKSALYDAMFAQAGRSLLAHAKSWSYSNDPRKAVRDGCLALWDFVIHNPAASQLLFERTIPGFEPSPSSYAFAQEFLAFNTDLLAAAGVTDPADVDIFTAILGGLFAQQETNEPGGDRWIRHLDTVLAMFFAHVDGRIQSALGPPAPHETPGPGPGGRALAPVATSTPKPIGPHEGDQP